MICNIKRLRATRNNLAIFDISGVKLIGQCCFIYGPSGVGKSTFLKALSGGTTDHFSDGVQFSKLVSFNNRIQRIRYVPQHPPDFDMTVRHFFKTLMNANRDCAGCSETLQLTTSEFGLESLLGQKMNKLSGGQLHRVHLVAAFSSNADLILLDEPTSAFDGTNIEILKSIIARFISNGGFLICCTHDSSLSDIGQGSRQFCSVDFPQLLPSNGQQSSRAHHV